MPPSALGWFTALWLTALGAAIGSFLNVVVYRLPRGESLIHPPSHCPRCGLPIRWYDNVPVLGWLILRGRCRDCQVPIPARYPIVEATCLLSFLVLAVLEVTLGGVNLPVRAVDLGGVSLSAQSDQLLYGTFLLHQLLLCTLLAAGLIQRDGNRVPAGLFWPLLVVGALAPLLWPGLRPVAATPVADGALAGLIDGALGLIAGWLAGRVLALLDHRGRADGLVRAMTCLGLTLGWQAALGIGLPTAAVLAARGALERRRPRVGLLPGLLPLVGLTFAWIVLWRPLVQLVLLGGW